MLYNFYTYKKFLQKFLNCMFFNDIAVYSVTNYGIILDKSLFKCCVLIYKILI